MNFTNQFIFHKFSILRNILSATSPSFWGPEVTFDLSVTTTEFQLRGLPHWHMLLWLNMPWNRKNLVQGSTEVLGLLKFYDTFVSTDPNLLDHPELQVHKCHKRCVSRRKKGCRFDFPRIPLPHSVIGIPPKENEPIMSRYEQHKMLLKIKTALSIVDNIEKSALDFYNDLGICQQVNNNSKIEFVIKVSCF